MCFLSSVKEIAQDQEKNYPTTPKLVPTDIAVM